MSAIFLLPVCLTYWPRKYTTCVDPRVDNSHQVSSWYDHPLPSYSVFVCWYVTWPSDQFWWPSVKGFLGSGGSNLPLSHWLSLFDLELLSYVAGHITNPATKFEDPTTIRSWVTSYNGSHWLPLKMRMRPVRMRRIMLPVSRGKKTITYLESLTPICLFTVQLLLGYDDDSASFTLESSNVKAVFGRKNSKSRRNGAHKWRFGGKMGVKTLDFGFATSKRHFLARNGVIWRILRQNRCTRLGCSLSQEPPQNSWVTLCRGARNHACVEPKPLYRFGWNFARW